MRPIDHFFSTLRSLERSISRPVSALEPQVRERVSQDFSRLAGPVIGAAAATDLAFRTLDHIQERGEASLDTLGYIAAFLLGEYDDTTMHLTGDDWREIQETIEDASGEMNVDTLTDLMGDLLSRGILK
jgi:hypothetical protein